MDIINRNGQFLVDSREVAEMTDTRHDHLLAKIDGYIKVLSADPNFRVSDFFQESSYQDSTGRVLKCFLLTRKGCDMVANKMTGEKGVLFTAAYVTKFDEMERRSVPQLSSAEMIAAIANQAVEQERRLKQLETRAEEHTEVVETIKETLLSRDEDWRKSINTMLNKAAYRMGGNYRDVRNRSYNELDERAHCDLDRRLRNLVERLESSGATKTQIKNTSRMDVIEADPRLKEIYTTIVKEISIGTITAGR